MLYKAKVSFAGKVSMTMGEVREISDSSIVKDLLKAKYIEEVKETKPKNRKEKSDGN